MPGIFRRADDKAITAHDLLLRRVPDDQLVITVAGEILLVYIHGEPRSAPRRPEGDLPQASDLPQQGRAFGGIENIDFIRSLVRISDLAFRGQFREQQTSAYRLYDGFHAVKFRAKLNNLSVFCFGTQLFFQRIRLFAYVIRPLLPRSAFDQLVRRNRLPDQYPEMFSLLRKHLVGQIEHLDIEPDTYLRPKIGKAVKEIG